MKNLTLYILLCVAMIIGIIAGIMLQATVHGENMSGYELYNCINNMARDNGFTRNPVLITKIQEQCVCFWQHNFTNLTEGTCN